jgi:hypothetical protein
MKALFGKRPSPYDDKNSSNKQRETTVHYFKTGRSDNLENVKNFESFFKCSCKNHQMFQNSNNRHISTSTVQRRLCESGLHGLITTKKPLKGPH